MVCFHMFGELGLVHKAREYWQTLRDTKYACAGTCTCTMYVSIHVHVCTVYIVYINM